MANVARTATAARTKLAAIATAVLGISLALTACSGGSSADGEYVRAEGDSLMSLVIDGNTVTHEVLDCDSEPAEEKSSAGELNDDRTVINWTTSYGDFDPDDGTFDSQTDLTITESTIVIPYTVTAGRGYTGSEDREIQYSREGSEQGKAARAEYQAECADSQAQAAEEETAEAEAAAIPIEDGTYYGYEMFGGFGLTVADAELTFYQVSCGPGMRVTPNSGTLSGREIKWDNTDYGPGQLVPNKEGLLQLDGSGPSDDMVDFFPEGTPGADEALGNFKELCGDVPFPIG